MLRKRRSHFLVISVVVWTSFRVCCNFVLPKIRSSSDLRCESHLAGESWFNSQKHHCAGRLLLSVREASTGGAADGTLGQETVILVGLVLAVAAYFAFGSDDKSVKGVLRANGLEWFVDRCDINFNNACFAVAARYPKFAEDAVFTYYDSYVAEVWADRSPFKAVPDLSKWKRNVQLLDRTVTDDFDDKRRFAELLQKAGCEEAFAPTYLSPAAAMEATTDDPTALFFIKEPMESGGKGMCIAQRSELDSKIPTEAPYVIQKAVQDISLISGRKFTVRFYLLVHDKALYLHRRGLAVVHGEPYQRDSTDYDVQVCSDALHDTPGGSATALLPWEDLEGSSAWHDAIAERLRDIEPAMRSLVTASSEDYYTLVGGDALIEESGEARLIELNYYPNLGSHNAQINNRVKQPVLEDVIAKVLLRKRADDFTKLYTA